MQQYLDFLARHWGLTTLLVVVLVAILIVEKLHQASGVKSVSPEEAVKLMNHDDAVVLDIREKAVFKNKHIIGSINIPKAEIEKSVNRIQQYQEKTIIVVCQIGQSATTVANKLAKQKFAAVKVLAGGLKAWQEADLPLEK